MLCRCFFYFVIFIISLGGCVKYEKKPLLPKEILQEILVQPLCGEDCQGICPSCGKNLNTEECNCEKETDSRFDILKELLK